MNNTIVKDLKSENLFACMIALTMIRYFLNNENLDDFLPQIIKLLKSPTSVIRKKSLLVIFDIYEKDKKLGFDIKKIGL